MSYSLIDLSKYLNCQMVSYCNVSSIYSPNTLQESTFFQKSLQTSVTSSSVIESFTKFGPIYIYVNCFCNHINYLRNCVFGNTKSIGYLPHATLIHQIIKNNCYFCIFHYVRSQFVTKKIKRFSWDSKIMFPFIRPNFIFNKTIPPFIWSTRLNLIFSQWFYFYFFSFYSSWFTH